jgi:restriction system protein
MDKTTRLLELARRRQASRWLGYQPLIDYHSGVYECDHVSPYTKSAANVDATVMVILQDWSSHDRLIGERDADAIAHGHTPSLPTNRNLKRLLSVHFGISLAETYGTNLFPFIKSGGLSSAIPTRDLERAAREFALPQIDIVAPRVAVCLGLQTFNALRRGLGMVVMPTIDVAIGTPFSRGNTRIWCQAHPGALGQNGRNRGGVDRVSRDWTAMRIDTGELALERQNL